MDSRVKRCIQTRLRMSKKVSYRYECLQLTRFTAFVLVKSVFSGMASYDKICILRRFCKLKSYDCTSLQAGQRWNTRCDMLNVTHRHVFVSQQVCRHQSFSVWKRAWPRLVDDSFVWKHVGRDKTWEIRWQVQTRPPMWKFAHGHELVSQTFFRGMSFYI